MVRQTTHHDYTGAPVDYVVPDGITEIYFVCYGAAGGFLTDNWEYKATGGVIRGILPVTPGETLQFNVGESPPAGRRTGGWNGGGDGGLHTETNRDFDGMGGGGATDVRQGGTTLSDRVIIAAGGGGSTGRDNTATPPEGVREGGDGGNDTGDLGQGPSIIGGGRPGTQTAGGELGGTSGIGGNGQGGTTTAEGFTGSGGGGGAGYYGGGGGEAGQLDSFNNPTNGRGGGGGSNGYAGHVRLRDQWQGNSGHGDLWLTPNSKPTVIVTSPAEGGVVTVPRPTYQWSYSDPEGDAQKAYRVKVFTQAQFTASGFDPDTSTAAFDSGKTFSSAIDHRFSGDLSNNTTYRVYVKVWEEDVGFFEESSSPWDYNEFTVANQKPVATITDPTEGEIIQDTSKPTVTWDYSDPEGDPQYEVTLWLVDLATNEKQIVFPAYSYRTTQTSVELPALNNGDYQLELLVKHEFGSSVVYSDWEYQTFTIDIPPPPVPNVTADYDPATATITINADNTGGSPTTEEMDVEYFDPVTNAWRIVRDHPNPMTVDANQAISPVVDYEYAPNIVNRYRARARYFDDVTGNTYVSAWNEVTVTPVQEEWWLKNLSDPSLNTEIYPNGTQLQMKKPRDMAFFEPIGRKHKLAVKSVVRGDEFPLTLDTLNQAQHDALEAILESSIEHTLLLQSPMSNGKQWYVEVENPVSPVMRNMVDPWYQFEVSFVEVTKP